MPGPTDALLAAPAAPPLGAPAISAAVEAAKPRRYRGEVKAWCPIRGTGAIKGEKGAPYDTLVGREEAEKCKIGIGAVVTFALKDGRGGRYEAADVRVIMQGFQMKDRTAKLVGAPVEWNRVYCGIIRDLWHGGAKSIFTVPSMARRDRGGSFIVSPEAHKVFELDVWAYPSKLVGFKEGDVINFKVEIDTWWSYPVAFAVTPVEPEAAQALKAEILERATGAGKKEKGAKKVKALLGSKSMPSIALAKPALSEVTAPGPPSDVDVSVRRQDGQDATSESVDLAVADGANAAGQDDLDETHGANKIPPAPSLDGVSEPPKRLWHRYLVPDSQSYWWWNEATEESFLEDDPGLWARYHDPDRGPYWWKSDAEMFWV